MRTAIEKIVLFHKDGSEHYIDNQPDIIAIIHNMPSKLLWKHTANIERLRSVYFAMVSELAKNTDTGYTKTDMHEAIKPLILTKFMDMPQYFRNRKPTINSVTNLSHDGWMAAIEQLKVVANDTFNYTFKDK